MGIGDWGLENGELRMVNLKRGMGIVDWGLGNGQWAMGNG